MSAGERRGDVGAPETAESVPAPSASLLASLPSAHGGAPGQGGGSAGAAPSAPEELRLAQGFLPTAGSLPLLATHAPTGHAPTPGMTSAVTRVPSGPTLPDWDPGQLGQAMLKMANEIFTTLPVEHGTTPSEHSTSGATGVLAPSALAALPAAALAPSAPAWATGAGGATSNPLGAANGASGVAPQLAAAPTSSGASPQGIAAPTAAAAAPAATTNAAPAAPAAPAATALPWLDARTDAGADPLPFSAPLDLNVLVTALEPPLPMSLPLLDHAPVHHAPVEAAPSAPDPAAPYWLAAAPASASAPPLTPSAATELSLPFDLSSAGHPFASPPTLTAPAAASPSSITGGAPAAPVAPAAPAPALAQQPRQPFDPHAIRRQFPILQERVHGKPLVWLDNAATTQKPQAVIDRLSYFYARENSNIHRAAHTLAARATEAYEKARDSVRRFLGAASTDEIIFVRGATEGINLIAQSWGRQNVGEGDEIVLTHLEHHANIVPWQQLAARCGARLRIAPVDDDGQILLDEYQRLLGPRTRLVAMTQVSNALGTITPARAMIEAAHRRGIPVLLDGAQAVSHLRVDVQALDCDFYVFSGHKVFAPTGIGAVYAKREILEDMPPWQGGGNMIADVTFEKTTYQAPPMRFEAGTGNIADAVGLGAALDWLTAVGIDNVDRYEHELSGYATALLATVPGLTMIGTADDKAGVLSFVLAGQHTQSVGGLLDQEGIAVRSGHHCAQPILRRFGVEATVRASLAPYNTREDIDALVTALRRLQARG